MGIFILSVQKSHSYIHKKRGRIPMRFALFIYSAKLKFLFRSLFSRFFNALASSTFFHALDS